MASVRVSVPTSLHSRHGIERDCEAAQGGDTRAEKIPLEPHAVNPIPRGRASKCPRPAVEIKCVVRPMLGFKSFRSARIILSAIELMHERERTNADGRGPKLSAAKQFYDPDISVPIASLSYPYERGTLRNAQAVGSYERRLQALAKVPLLIIDDIGLKPMCTPEDEDFHDLIAEQYERTSTVLSNLDFTEWDDAFATNKMLGAATLDGLCEALTMSLNSTAAHPGERTSIPLLQAVGQNSAQINNQHVNGR